MTVPKPARLQVDNLPTVFPNAAGLDIGSAEIIVAVPPDRDPQPVRLFATFTADLHALVDWLVACGIDTVAMESTGVFWIPIYELLEQAGITPLIAMKRSQHHEPVLERFTEPPALDDNADAVATMAHRLKTRSGRADYALRKQTVEPVFGIIKHAMKFRQFLVRGVKHVGHEWSFVALAWNIKRMNALKMA